MLGLVPKPVMWYAGCDYVRLTMRRTRDAAEPETLYSKVFAALVEEGALGTAEVEYWRWLGYYGKRCGPAAYGSSSQGHILQVSGSAAQDVSPVAVRFDGVPRCDAQVTIWLSDDDPNVAGRIARASKAFSLDKQFARWKVRLIEGFGDGDTAYIGSRASDCFVRCYDKGRESGLSEEYRNAWRFEVELADERAREVWALAAEAGSTTEYWASVVAGVLRSRGVVLPSLAGVRPNTRPRPPVVEDETARRLAWLRNQVRPAIDKLLAQGVSYAQVEEALGLRATE
jgi:hypothetical protein